MTRRPFTLHPGIAFPSPEDVKEFMHGAGRTPTSLQLALHVPVSYCHTIAHCCNQYVQDLQTPLAVAKHCRRVSVQDFNKHISAPWFQLQPIAHISGRMLAEASLASPHRSASKEVVKAILAAGPSWTPSQHQGRQQARPHATWRSLSGRAL